MQKTLNISIPEPNAKAIKILIKEQARRKSMSISQFMLWCWQKATAKE